MKEEVLRFHLSIFLSTGHKFCVKKLISGIWGTQDIRKEDFFMLDLLKKKKILKKKILKK